MENPCKELIENMFKTFGYLSDKGCDICNKKPARIEPRFGYTSCINHADINPIRFQEMSNKK